MVPTLDAKQVEMLEDDQVWGRVTRFFLLQDTSVQIVALGSALIGITCGLIGSYVVTRRLSLFGEHPLPCCFARYCCWLYLG